MVKVVNQQLYFSSAVILLLIVAAIIYKSIHNIIITFICAGNHAQTQDLYLSCTYISHVNNTYLLTLLSHPNGHKQIIFKLSSQRKYSFKVPEPKNFF